MLIRSQGAKILDPVMTTPVANPRSYGVLGAGAIGCVYGSRLWKAGCPVRFTLRSDLAAGLAHGLSVESPMGDVTVPPEQLCGGPAELGCCDGLLISLKSTANAQLPEMLAQLEPSPPTIVLLQNGLGGEEMVAAAAPKAVVIGAGCDIACSRVGPAQVKHYAYGLIRLAPLQDSDEARLVCAAVADDFRAAGVPVEIGSSLVSMRWHKLVHNMAFSGLCTVSGLRTLEVLGNPSLRQRLLAIMQEVISAAAADGAQLEPGLIQHYVDVTEAMASYAPSMQLDAEAGRPLELEAIYREPLRRAELCGVAMPETTQLLHELEKL